MHVPSDELEHYEAVPEDELDAEPKLSEEDRRTIRILQAQAAMVLAKAPDLFEWLSRRAFFGAPTGTMSERAVWRTGYEDCLEQVRAASRWETGEDDG